MAGQTLKLRIEFRWWVKPLIRLAAFNHSLGIPVDGDRLRAFILDHGYTTKIV